MSQNTNLQERYSPIIEAKLRKESVLAALFNRRHEGSPKAGAVKVPVRAEATVGSYSEENGATLNLTATTYVTIVCDDEYAVNELIPSYTAAAVPDNMVAERLDSGLYGLANYAEGKLAAALVTSGNFTASKTATATALTKSNIYEAVLKDITAAKKKGVKTSEMWLALSADAVAVMLQAPEFIRSTALGDNAVTNGVIGKIAGVTVVECLNLADDVDYVLGNSVYCHYVQEFKTPLAVNDLADGTHIGASAVQGVAVDGIKISKADTVFVKKHSA